MGDILKDKKHLTTEEVITIIVDLHKEHNLNNFHIKTSTGELISFERQLKAKYGHLNPVSSSKTIKDLVLLIIFINEKDIKNKTIDIKNYLENFRECFCKEIRSHKKFWQQLNLNKWVFLSSLISIISSFVGILVAILVAILK